MSPKAFIASVLALGIAVGLALPKPDRAEAQPVSQIQTIDLGR